ncbi:CAMK family protein kinase [Trichomonas vaginalis G3]|uniref:CAMK family protein kinase n=1 Tax=Trichomonas vaginalis (strain ATCC PRA-98 / G3) TaxID=412133 RepID=A2FGX2_TRIV3|nr:protein serine/threonine kinase protein [Trichomonas vaginalis G3]EAX95831.1 CAMK family protein kinase [Trichomonas vaginalis G3]KAI5494472.1 protein serine/threonine kinase protein [Trichomonas vaginalis G3]|eukprot:XP_001308761.1 CAMK family protein kinase [Trichomonas vaginalis G3]
MIKVHSAGDLTHLQRKVNQYNLLKTIGKGFNCKVLLIQDSITRKYFAAKIFKANRHNQNQLPLEREVKILKKIKHENIVRLHEVLYVPQKNQYYMIMEWGNCGSLQDIINSGINLSEMTISSIFKQIVHGLSYLHGQGFVHQDIKPSNVLIFSNGVAKIGDFGIGHSFQSADTVVGTPAYQAPEIFDDRLDEFGNFPYIDPAKEDVWSLGVTLYQVVFGKLPFLGNTVYEIVRNIGQNQLDIPQTVSPQLHDLIRGMLIPDPKKRLTLKEISENPFFKMSPDKFTPPINPVDPPKPNALLPISQMNASICDDSYQFAFKNPITTSLSSENVLESRSIS